MLGYLPQEISNMDARQFTHPDDRKLHVEDFKKLMNNEIDCFQIEKRYITKYGAEIYARTILARINIENGSDGYHVAIVKDIGEKKILIENQGELKRLRQRDELNKEEQRQLRAKLGSMNQELATNLIFISERNILLESINQSLSEISSKAGYEIKRDLFKLSSKVKNNIQLDEAWGKFKMHFDKTHPAFFSKLKELNPGLTQKEIKQCAYIRIGLSVKEAAQLLDVSPKSIEMARYRIKKKIQLSIGDNLHDYINSL
jgi:PAS domain S-box-containing protein